MIINGLTEKSTSLLFNRGLSSSQVEGFSKLMEKAQEQLNDNQSATQVLDSFSDVEMKLLQKATGLAESIHVDSITQEGATNLLAQPDKSDMVDLNNDGIVEVGAAQTITFPPVNAPPGVKAAWDKATEGMAEGDKLIMELHMHTAVYGVNIEGVTSKKPLPPEQQWSSSGVDNLLKELRSALDFSVAQDGWNRTNIIRRDFFEKFESALNSENKQ